MQLTYDAKSFLLNDRRIWIVAGEIHYFRHPRAEWREALLRAKRAGLNTISTYVPWNFHELVEGEADFEGDKDLGAYIDLIGEMGMYAMLRPGPYICSEWDGGGIPAWLCAKPVRRFREDDPVYMAAVESWFDRLIPIISQRQITKGGPVITVQNENEYPGGWDASMRRYILKLNDLFKKHGIEVPILACNVHGASETEVKINDSTDETDQLLDPGMILTYNHHVVIDPVYDLKSKQPHAPLIITEFWCGAPIYWGNHYSESWPPDLEQARAAFEYASAGTQVVYYMFDGGTNFGFWGGHNIATSYASSYPVGEGGRLTGKYYAVRPANLFAGHFGGCLADSAELPDKAGIRYPEGIRLVVRGCDEGAMVFVSAMDNRKEAKLTLPEGKELTVHLGEVPAAVLPLNLKIFGQTAVQYSNLALLVKNEGKKALVLYGPSGTEGVVCIDGQELRIPVGRRKIEHRTVAGINLIVADEEMATRCWIVEDQVVFGPDFAGDLLEDGSLEIKVSDSTPEVFYLNGEGCPISRTFRHAASTFTPPALNSWNMALCPEVKSEETAGWFPLAEPISHEKLGVVQGYVWYSAELDCEEAGIKKLLLTHAPNRVSVFVNGEFCGAHADSRHFVGMRDEYAHPADWAFEELTVRVRKGRNRFVFLSDSLGHNYDVPLPEGIQGPVLLGSRRVEIESFEEISPGPVSDDGFNFMYNRHYRTQEPLPAWEFELSLEAGEQAFISIHGVQAWVTVDGEDVLPMSYPESPWTMFPLIKRFISWELPGGASGRRSRVRIQYTGSNRYAVQENMTVYVAPKSGECSNWHWKPWAETAEFSASETVQDPAGEKDGIVVLLPGGGRLHRKGRLLAPSYFRTRFPMPEGEQPLYLRVGEMQKGQIFLNGRNAGRFWKRGGTQELYYLPRSWMKEENELVLFEELGLYPQNVSLVFGGGAWTGHTLELK